MTRSAIRRLAIVALAAAVAAAVSGTDADAQAEKTVSVYGSRPLAEAHRELLKQSRSLVSYEDAYYEFKGDLVDFTGQADPRQPNLNTPQMWFAPRRALVFDYPASDVTRPDVLFANLVSRYHNQYADYEYRLVREGMWLHILPAASRNAKGAWTPRASRFDVRVTLPDAERTVEATIKLLVDTVNKAASTNILFGVGGENLFIRTKIRTGAQDEIARHILMRALEATGRRVTWNVLCLFDETPGIRTDFNDGACGLNFIDVDFK